MLLEHNITFSTATGDLPLSLALNLEYLSNLLSVVHSSPEANRKHTIIEEYLLMMRSHEEMELISKEVQNSIHYYSCKLNIIEAEIRKQSEFGQSAYAMGAKCLLTSFFQRIRKLQQAMESTDRAIKASRVKEVITSSDSESDIDSDIDEQ